MIDERGPQSEEVVLLLSDARQELGFCVNRSAGDCARRFFHYVENFPPVFSWKSLSGHF